MIFYIYSPQGTIPSGTTRLVGISKVIKKFKSEENYSLFSREFSFYRYAIMCESEYRQIPKDIKFSFKEGTLQVLLKNGKLVNYEDYGASKIFNTIGS